MFNPEFVFLEPVLLKSFHIKLIGMYMYLVKWNIVNDTQSCCMFDVGIFFQVDISDVSDEYKVWSVLTDLDPTQKLRISVKSEGPLKLNEDLKPEIGVQSSESSPAIPEAVLCIPDPRVPQFGQRVILQKGKGKISNCTNAISMKFLTE